MASRRSTKTSGGHPVITFFVAFVLFVGLVAGAFWAVSGILADRPDRTEHWDPTVETEPRIPEPTGPDITYEGFDPTFIISDEQFFDKDAYSQEQIDAFLRKWNYGCRPGRDGAPCITEYREDSPSFESDQYCPLGFEGQSEDTPASIIWKSAQSCGVNPQVLLALIQKEQGLISASGARLDQTRYTIATGYACPDQTVCDPTYFGFAKQVYYAARQFRKYEGNPEQYMVQPGVPVAIPYAPEPGCEGPEITVANLATSNLYNYTPYQPNQAGLTGDGDACTTWGAQNFYAFFNAWFGTPEKALESATE